MKFPRPEPDEDPTGRSKRQMSLFIFLLFYTLVSVALVGVFYLFTHNWLLAIMLVGFMTTYMATMAWAAMK